MPFVPVSVIVPVRDGAALLRDALRSVEQQSWRPRQIVVVDGNSTDESAAVAAGFANTVFLHNPQAVAAEGRNIGAAEASEPCIAFLDADDLWPERRIELQLARLLQDPALDLVTGSMQQFRGGPDGEIVPQGPPTPSQLPSVALMRRAAFWRVGPFSTRWPVGETVEWCSRAVDLGLAVAAIPETVLLRRLHERNAGRTAAAPMKAYLEMLHSVVQRRRAAGRP